MIRERIYLDHNASSPVRPEVQDAVVEAMSLVGNASSVHTEGRKVRSVIEEAREHVAALCGVPAGQVIFTGGGTEANVLALSPGWLSRSEGFLGAQTRLFMSAIEHPSALKGGCFAPENIELLPVTADGVLDVDEAVRRLEAYRDESNGAPFLVSVMAANNETGALQPVSRIAEIVHELGGLLHSDAIQLAGKARLDMSALGADLVTISAHKLGGPRGVGALILARPDLSNSRPPIAGGGQERGQRGGTENVIGIAGFGAAAVIAQAELGEMARIKELRDSLETELLRIAPSARILCAGVERLPNTTCFAVKGMHGETLVIAMDLEGVAISAGSACSSGKVERSHVLDAMGVPPEIASGAVRISLGWTTQMSEIERFLHAWEAIYVRSKKRRRAA